MAQDVTKRVRYFDHQFLRAAEFQDEQDYHLDRRRRHNRLLHSPGVADGLGVDGTVGAGTVTVQPGTAYDKLGREIVLAAPQTVQVSTVPGAPASVHITIAYNEQQSDPSADPGITGINTRWSETPALAASTTPPADPELTLLLAVVPRDGSGNIATPGVNSNPPGRLRATVPPESIGTDQLAPNAVTTDKIAPQTVIPADIAPGAITEPKIAPNAVTEPKLANDAVSTRTIARGVVIEAKLANDAVSTRTIQANAVTATELQSDPMNDDNRAVRTNHIRDGAVTAAKILNGSVGTVELANAAVTNVKLAPNSVTADKIVDGSIGTAELANNSVPFSKIKTQSATTAFALTANSQAAVWYLAATGHRFLVFSVIPDTNGGEIEWVLRSHRTPTGFLRYKLWVKNLSAMTVQCRAKYYDILEM
ncbi:MAG: hypothetical protein ACE5I9_02815 [Candidatus Methylomirabilales bacterium]